MTRRWTALALVLGLVGLLVGQPTASSAQDEGPLTVYTYDSFVSFGAADVISSAFQEQTGRNVRFVATADSRTMLSRLISERESGGTQADAFVGVEANDLGTARENDVFQQLSSDGVPNLEHVPVDIRFDPENRLIPYEHGFITLVYDSEQIDPADVPRTFEELVSAQYRDSLIVEDPRTSSPGLSFLLWTIAQRGEDGYIDYWQELMPNVLTITQGWSQAFQLFTDGEAPMMVSFSTDHAFDVIVNDSDKLRVLTLDNQAYRTIFGMGVVRGTDQPELARQFLNVVLSPEVQAQLSETEWMIPANQNARVRNVWWQNVVVPEDPILLPSERVTENLDAWVDRWVREALQ